MRFIRDYVRHAEAPIPKWYEYSYTEFIMGWDIYYPLPINYIVRYWRKCYWKFLRFFYWVGLVDIAPQEAFHWGAFYRIKAH